VEATKQAKETRLGDEPVGCIFLLCTTATMILASTTTSKNHKSYMSTMKRKRAPPAPAVAADKDDDILPSEQPYSSAIVVLLNMKRCKEEVTNLDILSSQEEPLLPPKSVSPDDKLGGIPFLLAVAQREGPPRPVAKKTLWVVSSPKVDSAQPDDDDDDLGGVRILLAASQAARSISRKPPPPPKKTRTRRKKRVKATLPMYGKSGECVGMKTKSAENGGRESAASDGGRVLRRKTESALPSSPPVKLEPSEEELKSTKHDRARNALLSFYQRLNEFCAFKAEFGNGMFAYTILEVSIIL
jgi:hypothetical protein